MANNTIIKEIIEEYIKYNAAEEITGDILQGVLLQMVIYMTQGRTFAGIATPMGTPVSYDRNVFWFAIDAGTYTNFGNLTLPKGLSLILYNEEEGVGSYSTVLLFAVDSTPTRNSTNLVDSNGVYTAIKSAVEAVEVGATEIYDVSAVNAVSGVPAAYATLQAALSFVPAAYKKGGISVKYIDSNTNEYVQYRLTATTWSTTASSWEKAPGSNITHHSASETSVTIVPNVLHIWDTPMESLSVTLGSPLSGQISEYMIRFTVSSSSEAQISISPDVAWVDEPDWNMGSTYEISIVNGLAICAEWIGE